MGEEIGWENLLFQPIFRSCRTRRQEAQTIFTIAEYSGWIIAS